MDASRCIFTREMFHNQPKISGYEYRPPFGARGNHGNNTLPRSPRKPLTTPPRYPSSHHEVEANDEIPSEQLMRFEQDEVVQCLMHVVLEHNGDQ